MGFVGNFKDMIPSGSCTPEERESNFWAFGTGAAAYAAVLLLI